jgi:hypothetical protein
MKQPGIREVRGEMTYTRPELRFLGSLAALTLGQMGSCPDAGGLTNQRINGQGNCSTPGMGGPKPRVRA